jgi:hypothetical protein
MVAGEGPVEGRCRPLVMGLKGKHKGGISAKTPGSFQSHLNRGLPGSAVYDLSTVRQQINRLKMLKRQMYGRAGIELLRARLLLEPEFSDP